MVQYMTPAFQTATRNADRAPVVSQACITDTLLTHIVNDLFLILLRLSNDYYVVNHFWIIINYFNLNYINN